MFAKISHFTQKVKKVNVRKLSSISQFFQIIKETLARFREFGKYRKI